MSLDGDAREMLQDWLERTLAPLCDADPAVLSKYVLALVQGNPNKNGLIDICCSKLKEFLGDDTKGFVDRLFHSLNTKSYMQKKSPKKNISNNSIENDIQNQRRSREYEEEQNIRHKRQKRSKSRSKSPRDNKNYERKGYPIRDTRREQIHGRSRGGRSIRSSYDNWMAPPHPHPSHGNVHHWYPRPIPSMGISSHGIPPHEGEIDATTLRVENIDSKFINMVKLSGHFSRYGDVVNVQMRPEFKAAFVQFSSNEAARKAYHSPLPVCNNRFISVKYAKYPPKNLGEIKHDILPEELRLAALEKGKKILNEKKKLIEENKNIEKKKEILLNKQIITYEILLNKMNEKNLNNNNEYKIMEKKIIILKNELNILKNPLQKLKNELNQLENKINKNNGQYHTSIDNRTKILKLLNVPDILNDIHLLEQYFNTFGTILNIHLNNNIGYIQFKQRYEAEKALKFGHIYMDIPLEMTWHQDQTIFQQLEKS